MFLCVMLHKTQVGTEATHVQLYLLIQALTTIFMPCDSIFLPKYTGTVNDAPSPGKWAEKKGVGR